MSLLDSVDISLDFHDEFIDRLLDSDRDRERDIATWVETVSEVEVPRIPHWVLDYQPVAIEPLSEYIAREFPDLETSRYVLPDF